ncbi:hypothetical protein [Streptomyces uncialis]|uniref:hypothetical protein n=1 Tax=Streptomyces uncialis TaxID=1048205 RepID=UPI002258E0B0|nr:hypothetical protein [Streptomyces uncialis]MCX4661597.1 hypothetical protein [Streptomyces uncialis]
MTAHWWTGVGGVVGVLGLFVGVLAWLAPAGDDEVPAAGKADHQGQERWSSVKSLGNAPLDLDPVPPTADRRPPTADRRPPTADRRPPTADRRPGVGVTSGSTPPRR